MALLLAAVALSSVLSAPAAAAATESGEADHAVQQHSERISGPAISPNLFLFCFFLLKSLMFSETRISSLLFHQLTRFKLRVSMIVNLALIYGDDWCYAVS